MIMLSVVYLSLDCLSLMISGAPERIGSAHWKRPNAWSTVHYQSRNSEVLQCVIWVSGAPERIRTSDLCLRRAALYPAELRVH
jgi:hypothetical protein